MSRKHGICIVHDFAYGGIGFDEKKPVSFLQAEGAKEVGIEIYTLSKTFNMAGWRVGFAAGNASVIAALNLMQDHLYVSLFGAVQEAAAAALSGSQDCVKELNSIYESRRNTFISGLREIGWDVQAPQGSFLHGLRSRNHLHLKSFLSISWKKRILQLHQAMGSANLEKDL